MNSHINSEHVTKQDCSLPNSLVDFVITLVISDVIKETEKFKYKYCGKRYQRLVMLNKHIGSIHEKEGHLIQEKGRIEVYENTTYESDVIKHTEKHHSPIGISNIEANLITTYSEAPAHKIDQIQKELEECISSKRTGSKF